MDCMENNPAPEEILQLVHCQWQTGCESARCSCLRAKMSCTDACRCQNCSNTKEAERDFDEEDSEDSEE